jgi:TatD DNase family protein
MILVDTHTHLYLPEFDDDRAEVVQSAIQAGVEYMLLPNVDSGTFAGLMELNKQFPKNCLPMAGLHPTSVNQNYLKELQFVENQLFNNPFIAVGEIGIDLYWDKTFFKEQQDAFRQQIKWAKELKLPIVVHARDSFSEIFPIIEQEADSHLRGVFHSFTGTESDALQVIDLGLHIGLGGIFTFKNSGLDKIMKNIDCRHLILETDSPYLAPTPKRGRRNESAYVVHVAQKLADLKEMSIDEVAKITTKNAFNLFNMDNFLKNE